MIAAILALCPQKAAAQADAQFSQYFEVPNYYNAGAIGTTDLLKIRAGARMQWVGIKNAPSTFLVAADMPFKFINKRFGVGLVMQQKPAKTAMKRSTNFKWDAPSISWQEAIFPLKTRYLK